MLGTDDLFAYVDKYNGTLDSHYDDICYEREKLLTDGTCEICPSFTALDFDGKNCSPKMCNPRERLLENGFCETCDAYYETDPDEDDVNL